MLFGTDGIRGIFGEYPLVPETILKISKATAALFRKHTTKLAIGMDTRKSSPIIGEIISKGFRDSSFDVFNLGVIPTPGVALYCKAHNSLGIVISASHNPAEYNGIKFFSPHGYKLNDKEQAAIENALHGSYANMSDGNDANGKIIEDKTFADEYADFLAKSIATDLDGLHILIDCANGASSPLIPRLKERLLADIKIINNAPNGSNINENCGATNPVQLCDTVKLGNFHFGVALDGDADRAVFCDEKGNVVNGNKIVALVALHMKENKELKKNKIAINEMSNAALINFLKANGIKPIITKVGDRFILEAVKEHNLSFGAEPNGHSLFANIATTDDGTLFFLKVAEIVTASNKRFSKLVDLFEVWPEKLINIKISERRPLEELRNLQEAKEKAISNGCHVLLRYSGTEPLLRIFLQAENNLLIEKFSEELSKAAKEDMGELECKAQ